MGCIGCEIKEEAANVDVKQLIEEQLALEIHRVDAPLLEKRLSICRSCPFRVNHTCSKCGCFYEFRANLSMKHCPERYW